MDNIKDMSTCNSVQIKLGEKAVLNDFGCLQDVTTGDVREGFTFVNNCEDFDVHPGIIQLHYGINMEPLFSPCCFMPNKILSGTSADLIPEDIIVVWMDQEFGAGTMFTQIQSPYVEVDLTNRTEAHILYDGTWRSI